MLAFTFHCIKEWCLVVCSSCRLVYNEYSKEMCDLSLSILEIMGLGLGLERRILREFFEANDSILRLNYYPRCPKPDLTLGTGAHYDPTSLTILHQDEISGLQVFIDDKWRSISPNPNALVINVGDTLMVFPLWHRSFILFFLVLWFQLLEFYYFLEDM